MSSSFGAVRRAFVGAASLAAALLLGTAGHAAVLYDFQWFTLDDEPTLLGSFQYTSADFITDTRSVEPEDLDSCSASGFYGGACATMDLRPDSSEFGVEDHDLVIFGYTTPIASRGVASRMPIAWHNEFHFFEDGALGKVGTYGELVSEFNSVLTVSIVPDAVPEPATWAMLITGFGLAGATLRRRQYARP